MADRPQKRTLADLDGDVLSHCAGFLDVRDLASLASSCKPLRSAAYSDSVWSRLFRKRWPHLDLPHGALGFRDMYLDRYFKIQQMRFDDPLIVFYSSFSTSSAPCHLLLDKNDICFAQGSVAKRVGPPSAYPELKETFSSHGARITCMRLFPIADTSLFRSDTRHDENLLVTSSADRTIRLWWKGRSQRCFKGHSGPVTVLSDKLIGDVGSKVLASGGEDCTVRLWSISSSRKNHSLTMTYHGHERALSLLSVAWHKPSLLVSISRDSKMRVWDTAAPASSCSSSCVGSISIGGPPSPIAMQCHDTLCYITTGSQVTTLDLRTMKKAFTAAAINQRIYSFGMLPSKWSICTGADDKALLWDIRKSQEVPKPVAELESYGPVKLLYMDQYKVMTGGPLDCFVNVWEAGTGVLVNQLNCRQKGTVEGVSAMAVNGCRLVTVCCSEYPGDLYYIDFSDCSVPISLQDTEFTSKFWGSRDSDED